MIIFARGMKNNKTKEIHVRCKKQTWTSLNKTPFWSVQCSNLYIALVWMPSINSLSIDYKECLFTNFSHWIFKSKCLWWSIRYTSDHRYQCRSFSNGDPDWFYTCQKKWKSQVGFFFKIWLWLSSQTQIVRPESIWDNNHFCDNFWPYQKMNN